MVELTAHRSPAIADERAARAQLRRQIARLEAQLSDALVGGAPCSPAGGAGGPHVLSLGELERVRDALAARLAGARVELQERAERQAASRALLERMLRDPRRHKFVRVANRDLGEPGCGVWHVRPRLGLIGMLAGWWQVKLSSGCPLTRATRPGALTRSANSGGDRVAELRYRRHGHHLRGDLDREPRGVDGCE
jgi:hypothetical protein